MAGPPRGGPCAPPGADQDGAGNTACHARQEGSAWLSPGTRRDRISLQPADRVTPMLSRSCLLPLAAAVLAVAAVTAPNAVAAVPRPLVIAVEAPITGPQASNGVDI